MIETTSLVERLSNSVRSGIDLGEEPTKEEIREEVGRFKESGLCGRRIGQQHLGPYFLASDVHGQHEIDLLEEVLNEEYEGTDFCIRERSSECSRLRGGCKYS